MTMYLYHIANCYYLVGEDEVIYKVWYDWDFTERKLNNALEKLEKNDPNERKFTLKGRIGA